ncbi:MAG: N-acetylmuramoyl-L-alanine amidase, partial [Desulfatiglandales bacterium]|nr:N-acetylmuramoyl-L-alanine amidase [Desulfatiglandales bacterium]
MEGLKALGKTPSKPKIYLQKADKCRDSLYRSSKRKKYRENWLKCINSYQKVYTRYPKSAQAIWANYRSAQMFTELYRYSGREGYLDEAIKLYERVAEEHRRHRLADDAQYRIGEIYYRHKKNPTQAYVEFLNVDIKFPSGDMRPKALAMLDKLSLILNKGSSQKKGKKDYSSARRLTTVKNIHHWSYPSYTRVVIDLERPVKYIDVLLKKDRNLKKPRRLYVDLKKTYVSSAIESSIPIRDGLLRRARAGQYSRDTVRVVLDINNYGGYKIFHLFDPFRIVVDVWGIEKRDDKKKRPGKAKKRRPRKGVRKVQKADKKVSLQRQFGLNVRKIVLDPGHGGKDPGTLSKNGIKEKHIVLKLARILAKKIEKRLGLKVILTGEGGDEIFGGYGRYRRAS